MPTRPPPSDVPLSRGIIVHALHGALREIWGDGGLRDALARLPSEVASDTSGPEFLAIRWYPTSHIMAWHHAVLDGPARRDDRAFADCMQRASDISNGLVRRAFMRILTPDALADKAAELWSTFHTHGLVTVDGRTPGSARMVIREHPFVDDEVSRRVILIMSRHMMNRSRARNVRLTQELVARGHMVVHVTWTP